MLDSLSFEAMLVMSSCRIPLLFPISSISQVAKSGGLPTLQAADSTTFLRVNVANMQHIQELPAYGGCQHSHNTCVWQRDVPLSVACGLRFLVQTSCPLRNWILFCTGTPPTASLEMATYTNRNLLVLVQAWKGDFVCILVTDLAAASIPAVGCLLWPCITCESIKAYTLFLWLCLAFMLPNNGCHVLLLTCKNLMGSSPFLITSLSLYSSQSEIPDLACSMHVFVVVSRVTSTACCVCG